MAKQRVGATLQQQAERQPMNWNRVVKRSLALLSVGLVVAVAYYINDPETLPIKHVTVDGDIRYTDRDSLERAVSPYVRGSFMDVDVADVQRAGESLPWVRRIQVKRVWPDTLHVIVNEHVAVARWNDHALISSKGVVFYPPAETMPTELVWLRGPDDTSEMMARRLVDTQRRLNALGLKITTVSINERRSWQLGFSNGLNLKLGRAMGDERLTRFIEVYQRGLKRFEENIVEIDMRYTNGLAVTWKDGQRPDFNGKV